MNPKTKTSITNKGLLGISFLQRSNKPRQWVFIGSHFVYSYVLPTLFSFVFSYAVVQKGSLALWGEYVFILSIVSVGSLIAQWGGKEWLIRTFSEKPSHIFTDWGTFVWPRVFLAIAGSPLVIFFLPNRFAWFGMAWLVITVLLRYTEVIFVYHKSYKSLVLCEFIYGICMLTIILIENNPSMELLCWGTLAASLFKLVLLWFHPICKQFLPTKFYFGDFSSFFQGFSFFLLSLLGLLDSRIDIFCIKHFYSLTEVGRFSIALQMLLLLKNIPAFIIQPLTKNLYRSSEQVKSKVSQWFMIAGIVISIGGVSSVGLICYCFFGLLFSWNFYFMAMAYVFPQFLCSMEFLRLFQQKRVHAVIIGLGLEIIVHLSCNLMFIQTFGVEIVILSAALGQWTLYFYLMNDKTKKLGFSTY